MLPHKFLKSYLTNQKGTAPLLLLIAVLGIASYFLLSNTLPFKNSLFSQLFPKGSSFASNTNDTGFLVKVLVVKYFPVTSDGQNIDLSITGDVGRSLSSIQSRVNNINNNLLTFIPKATKYLGYKDSTSSASLSYSIVDTKEYLQGVPLSPTDRRPLY